MLALTIGLTGLSISIALYAISSRLGSIQMELAQINRRETLREGR